jgi:SAM-dependent methyltransferase
MSIKIDQLSEPGEYDDEMLTLLQIIWGDGFLSPGGGEEIMRLLEGSDITGCQVLDIGCGLGAIDELLVTRFGAGSVLGIDIDPRLIAGMQRRIETAGLAERIKGQAVEGGPLPFAAASFDVVFSKDSLVQIPDKGALFSDVIRVLRPGGHFIASDWLRGGSGPYSAEMLEYFRLEGIAYNMATLGQSADALREAGFADIVVRDRHDWYRDLAKRELEAMEGDLEPVIIAKIGADRAKYFLDNWRQLVVVLERGELRPGHLKAIKPAR